MIDSGGVQEVDILGVPVAALDMCEAVRLLVGQFRADGRYIVFTPNPEMIDRSRRDNSFRHLLLKASLRVADGVGVLWASRLQGEPLPGTVPGVDLMNRLLAECASSGIPVFFLGTTAESVNRAVCRARQRYDNLLVAGYHHGFFSQGENSRVVSSIAEARPRLVISGMGVPKDQRFLVSNLSELPPAVYLAVGGGLDIMAGTVTRAPNLVRRMGLEWLYRLIESPGRWRRQLALVRFAAAVMRKRIIGG